MKINSILNKQLIVAFGFILAINTGCERDPSDDSEFATFGNNPAVFIDGFSGGLEYLPFAGSKLDAFTVDDQTFYEGTASMRFDVPNVGDPDGAFAGAIFPDNGGRDLTGYDALTFWAKATKGATINEIGFGQDFGENKYQVAAFNLSISTGWKKYIIPIPDPSKLTQEKGLFWYSEGPEDGEGYTFWIDELQFENLGTVAQPRPAMFTGEDIQTDAFIGVDFIAFPLTQTFNLENGLDQTVLAAPGYFEFLSSNTDVATINAEGLITVVGTGSSKITASLDNVAAAGSIMINSAGDFIAAPTPTRDAANVVSIFSDAYNDVQLNAENPYNGFFLGDGQTTQGGRLDIGDGSIINYTALNFVSVNMFTAPDVDASAMTHIHVDINVRETLDDGDFLNFQIINNDGEPSFSTGTVSLGDYSPLLTNEWVGYDIPLTDFTGLNSTEDVDLIFFISNSTISEIYVDNIYFYRE